MMINFDGELIGVKAARKLLIYIVSVVFVVCIVVSIILSIDICFVFTADITVANDNNESNLTLLDYLTLLSDGADE